MLSVRRRRPLVAQDQTGTSFLSVHPLIFRVTQTRLNLKYTQKFQDLARPSLSACATGTTMKGTPFFMFALIAYIVSFDLKI